MKKENHMFDADVKESGADVTLTFGGHTITLPAEKAKIVKEKGITKIHISLSDTDKLAVAYVVAEGD